MYRAGVIGCGSIGIAHAEGLMGLDNAEVVAACDVSPEVLGRFVERWPDRRIARYASHRDLLARERLDIVTVATSDHQHADLVVDAAQAGVKGIFCEKPLATNLADADRMLEAVERGGVILSIDHTRRWQPVWRYAREEIVGKGVLGPVQYLVGTLNGPRAMLFRNGTHLLDAICYFAQGQPRWVVAELEDGYQDYHEYRGDGGHQPATEPGAYGFIHFDNGVRAFYVGGSKRTPPAKQFLEVVGTEGRLVLGDMEHGTLYRGPQAEPIPVPQWPVQGIAAGVQELVQLLAEGGEPVSPGRAGHLAVELIIGFLESARQGHVPVPIPVPRQTLGR
jgi:predicted dehydrogenase